MSGENNDQNIEGTETGNTDPQPKAPAPKSEDRGFPENTPVKDMTDAQQAAYWKFHARKHENIASERGDYDNIRKERDELLAKHQSAEDKALAEAKEAGRMAALAEVQPRLVSAAFLAAAPSRNISEEQVQTLVQGINPSRFLTDKGDVDTEKVKTFLASITPTPDPGHRYPDMGAGPRDQIKTSGRQAGEAEADKRFGTQGKS